MPRLRILALLSFAAVLPAVATERPPTGLWIHHGEWEFAPKEFN